jgi:hypothetical protein
MLIIDEMHFCATHLISVMRSLHGCGMLVRMHDAEIERILRAMRTPLGISASGVASRMRRVVDPCPSSSAGERRPKTRVKEVAWIPGFSR